MKFYNSVLRLSASTLLLLSMSFGTSIVYTPKAVAAGWCEVTISGWFTNRSTGETIEFDAYADTNGNHWGGGGDVPTNPGDIIDVVILSGGQGDTGPYEQAGNLTISGATINDAGQTQVSWNPGDPQGTMGPPPFYFTRGASEVVILADSSCRNMDESAGASLEVYFNPAISFTCSVLPATHTLDQGSSYSYDIESVPTNGFNSPVTYTSSISPSVGNPPVISFTNNGQSPPATTEANITTSSGPSGTTAGPYTLTFTGTGGGVTRQCTTQLTVNPSNPNFELQVTPGPEGVGVPPSQTTPNRILVGQTKTFTVVAVCTGGFTGPITQLEAVSEFTGVTMSFSPPGSPPNGPTVNCGSSISLIANNSSSVTEQELSGPSSPPGVILKGIVVRGRGQVN